MIHLLVKAHFCVTLVVFSVILKVGINDKRMKMGALEFWFGPKGICQSQIGGKLGARDFRPFQLTGRQFRQSQLGEKSIETLNRRLIHDKTAKNQVTVLGLAAFIYVDVADFF